MAERPRKVNLALNDTDRVETFENGLAPRFKLRGRTAHSWPLRERMAHYQAPGLSLAVIVDGRIAWAKAYGARQVEKPGAVDTETIFQAASISKPVAAVTALRLVDKGLLNLDEPVNNRLLNWVLPDDAYMRGGSVTLRHLLAHNGGVNIHGYPGYPRGAQIPSTEEMLRGAPPANTPAVAVAQKPGQAWRYSGGGYTVIQQLIEDVTGSEFSDVAQDLVLDPAGMAKSTFEQPLTTARFLNSARAHAGPRSRVVDGGAHLYPELAAAGLWSTPADLARFALALTSGPQPTQNLLLNPATRVEILSRQAGDWGLGVQLVDAGDGVVFRHAGGNHGYRADWFAYEDGRGGAAVMTNADQGEALIREVLASVASLHGWRYQVTQERELASYRQAFSGDIPGSYAIPALQERQRRMDIVHYADGFLVTIEDVLPCTKFYLDKQRVLFSESGIEMKVLFDKRGLLTGFDLGQGVYARRLSLDVAL